MFIQRDKYAYYWERTAKQIRFSSILWHYFEFRWGVTQLCGSPLMDVRDAVVVPFVDTVNLMFICQFG